MGELIVFVEFVRTKLNHEIIQNSDACTMQLCPKTKTNNYTKPREDKGDIEGIPHAHPIP